MFLILRPLRLFIQAFITESTPRQMAFGLAMGVFAGLVPKGNLLAILLGTVLAATRINLAIATFAVVLCSLCATLFDSFFDRIGSFVLGQPSLQGLFTEMINTPFVPWTDFNNSIVMGSFVTGLMLIFPTYRLSRPLFEKYSDKLSQRLRQWRYAKLLLGAEWANRIAAVE
ncbi:MAG: TIGR03546 family protein [Planctomycetota bacterium]